MRMIETYKRIAAVQAAGGVAALIDELGIVNLDAARAAGVVVAELLVSQPDTTEQADEIAETLRRAGSIDLIIRLGGSVDHDASTLTDAQIAEAIQSAHDYDIRSGDLYTLSLDGRGWHRVGFVGLGGKAADRVGVVARHAVKL